MSWSPRGDRARRKSAWLIVVFSLTGQMIAANTASGYQRPTGEVVRVNVDSSGKQTKPLIEDRDCYAGVQADISADGRFAVFASSSPDLVSGDNNLSCDVFVHDLVARKTDRVSVASDGSEAVGACPAELNLPGSWQPSISATGRYVAFTSCAINLVSGDTNLARDVFVHDRKTGDTRRVSVATDGGQAMEPIGRVRSQDPQISGNGKRVVFMSEASNLVGDDSNGGAADVFLHDIRRNSTELVSLFGDGTQSDGFTHVSGRGSIDHKGERVAFIVYRALDSELQRPGVYVRDTKRDKTVRVSVASDGTPAESLPIITKYYWPGSGWDVGGRSISANGRYVSFSTSASNLIPSDRNGLVAGSLDGMDLFVHDLVTRRTERISVDAVGREQPWGGVGSIGPDGRYVVLHSSDPSYFEGGAEDPEHVDQDVYVFDRLFGKVMWASTTADGEEAAAKVNEENHGASSTQAGISEGGRFVLMESWADNLVTGDTNETGDYFVKDIGLHIGAGTILGARSVRKSGFPLRSDVVSTWEDQIGDGSLLGDIRSVRVAHRESLEDVYVRVDVESLALPKAGSLAASLPTYGFRFTAQGDTYEVKVKAGPHGNGVFSLFRCTGAAGLCDFVTSLEGGYGTITEAFTFSIPTSYLKGAASLSDPVAFSLLGSTPGAVLTSGAQLIDRAAP